MGCTGTDEDLLQRVARGDTLAFIELYEQHRDLVFRFAYRVVGSADVAADVTTTAFWT